MITDLYVENNIGKGVRDVINMFTKRHGITAHHQHEIHPEMQRAQFGDEWWIEDVAARGMAILCQDTAILESPSEKQALVGCAGVLIALANGQYNMWQKLQCVVRHWDTIEAALGQPGPQAVTIGLSKVEVIDLSLT